MNRLLRTAAALVLTLLVPATVLAELRRVDLKVLGMDWTTCAHAVRVAVQKLDGVESVEVSLQRQSANIRLRPGNRVTLPKLRQIIKDSGFTAKEATVAVVGTLVERGGKPALDATGLGSVLLLVSDPKHPDAYHDVASRLGSRQVGPFEIVGVIHPPANATQPEEIVVQSVAAAAK